MAGSAFYIKSPDFNRHVSRMKRFKSGWRPMVRQSMADVAERVIELAKEEKPDLSGRTGLLNLSWTYTKPRYYSMNVKSKVQNLAPYAHIVEEGVSNPNPHWVHGFFSNYFTTGHGLPMFFASGEGSFYYMPTKPWDGFAMLETAIHDTHKELGPMLDTKFMSYARMKGVV